MNYQKNRLQLEQGRSLNFYELEELCDDPSRNESGEEVHAVLKAERYGFTLSVRDGIEVYKIIDAFGRQVRFKSVDSAVERLSDVPHLWPEIIFDISRCRIR